MEFFELVQSELNPNGMFALWFHSYEQSDAAVKLVFRTLSSVFPHVMMFGDNDLDNLIAVASMGQIEPDFAKMDRRFGDPKIRTDLARLGISNLAGLLSHYRLSQDRFSTIFGPGPLNTVRHERLEYIGPRSFFSHENSFFLDRFDPLVQVTQEETDIMLDRYIAYRTATGHPMPRGEFEATARYAKAMGGYGRRSPARSPHERSAQEPTSVWRNSSCTGANDGGSNKKTLGAWR